MGKYRFQILTWLKTIGLSGFNQAVKSSTGLGSINVIAEQAGLTTHHEWMDCILCQIVIDTQVTFIAVIVSVSAIGSGEIESSNRSITQKRLKIPGAWWKSLNMGTMLCLKTLRSNGEWGQYWKRSG